MPTLLTPYGTRVGGIRADYEKGFITREEDHHFVVKADDIMQSRTDILFNTPGLPKIGLTILNGMLCKGGTADRQEEHGLRWDVVFTFTNNLDADDGNQQQGDPTLWIPIRRTLFERIEEVFVVDINGQSVANSAGQPFENGISIGRHIPIWEFYQFERVSITDEMILARNETVNSISKWGRDPKTWLLKVVDSTVGFYAGYRARLTIYRLAYNYRKWTHKRLDVGVSYWDGTKLLPYLDDDNPPNQILGPLNGSGAKQPTRNTPPASVEFDQFPTSDFSFLRF